ncbi:elongator complex protein 3 [Tissierella creatinophila]|uniref:Oxygen-independent coproporphyrinogen-III oxidase-like protein n=1 Tax=Tissierella creatinophila DSM 6911 TaxID=1123403 RepID=A0A1U7M336_TISCR|nr:radical SAM protein [Tissierella creatinophila]OLS01733.1 oxygen-independent coproporphyrinogen-III oxidase-like protein [Tissierella creatinophila DSM 6911]
MSKHYIIPIFVPHLGCPHDCIFCNQRKIASSITDITTEDVEETIKRYLSYFKKNSFIEVAFYGGSFTAIDINVQKDLLKVPLQYKKEGIIDEIRLSTRPDAIDDFILTHLKEYEVDTIELGVQSLNDEVLDKSGRGHSSKDVYRAVKLIKDYKFNLGLQMMVGLPGDTLERSLDTAKIFIKLNPKCVRIYPTLVIKDTYLEKMALENNYNPLSLKEAIDICTPLLMAFYVNNINVIRVGLQPTENIQLGKDVIDGPFHPAFKQLVEANIYRIVLNNYIRISGINTKGKTLEIFASNKNISNLAGQKSENISYLQKKHQFNKIKIYSKDMKQNEIIIIIDKHYDKININEYMERYLQKMKTNE